MEEEGVGEGSANPRQSLSRSVFRPLDALCLLSSSAGSVFLRLLAHLLDPPTLSDLIGKPLVISEREKVRLENKSYADAMLQLDRSMRKQEKVRVCTVGCREVEWVLT